MQRYKNTRIGIMTKDDSNVESSFFETSYFLKVPETDDDTFIIPQHGDRLDLLANQFYGDSTLWWFIAHVNDIYTMNIPVGTSLRIPPNDSLAMMG